MGLCGRYLEPCKEGCEAELRPSLRSIGALKSWHWEADGEMDWERATEHELGQRAAVVNNPNEGGFRRSTGYPSSFILLWHA